ncbi:MAG: hypothetical protein AAF318_05060 [Pseudomonadota bacterium]
MVFNLSNTARAVVAALALTLPFPAAAGPATVEAVAVTRSSDGTYQFSVTVRHADTGWEHYADAFVVSAPDGTVLGTRTLFHPHVNEQPFTRSLSGVALPAGLATVRVHANDSVHGPGPAVTVSIDE